LAAKTHPDISYAVHQAARFSHNTKNNHALSRKRIVCYLKKTQDKGVYAPIWDIQLSCYVDSDFGGLFGSELILFQLNI